MGSHATFFRIEHKYGNAYSLSYAFIITRKTHKFIPQIDYFHQQMHQDKFVTVSLLKECPNTYFGNYIAIIRGLFSELLHRPILSVTDHADTKEVGPT